MHNRTFILLTADDGTLMRGGRRADAGMIFTPPIL